MKDKILAALKTKFDGIAEAVLIRIATKLAETVKEEKDVATAVEGVTHQRLLDSYGDSRAEEATISSVTNYRKKHGLGDDGKPIKKEETQDEKTARLLAEKEAADKLKKAREDEPPWFADYRKTQEDKIDALNKKLDGQAKEKRKFQFKTTVIEKLKEKKIPEWYYEGRTLDVEEENGIDTLVESTETAWNAAKQKMTDDGIITSIPGSGDSSKGGKGTELAKGVATKKNKEAAGEGLLGKKL